MSRDLHRRLFGFAALLAMTTSTIACAHNGSSSPRSLAAVTNPSPSAAHPSTSRQHVLPPRQGVTAAIHVYYRVANHLRQRMDATRLASLFTPGCSCQAQVRAVRRGEARGEHYIDHANLNAVRVTIEAPTLATALVDLNASTGGLVTADGTVVTSAPPRRHIERLFHLRRLRGRWLIDQIDAVS